MSRAWMPLYVADYLADTGHLSTSEHGAYLLLIMHYWQNGGLPDEDRRLARICRMTPEEWAEARLTLADLFGEGWSHKRIDEELSAAKDLSEKAKAKAAKRWQSNSNAAADAAADAAALPQECQSQSQSQSPISEPSVLQSSKRERANPWPDDYQDRVWAIYPKHTDRKTGMVALEALHRADKLPWPTLLKGIDRLREHVEPKFCPSLDRWLKKEKWNDEFPDKPTIQRQPSRPSKSETFAAGFLGVVQERPDGRDGRSEDLRRPDAQRGPADEPFGSQRTIETSYRAIR